ILRSGTSPAPNYGEARGAESRRDFVHKLKIVLKELNETGIWLKVIRRSEMLLVARVSLLEKECNELGKIINTSIKTTLSKRPQHIANG
ncbi:MAG: four helix bundle protein, partial [Bacteroidetes bacterium]|nr:four helix bundle protein [Bacteroidota bacterium]